MRISLALSAFLVLHAKLATAAGPCADAETAIFSCDLGTKVLSVCQLPDERVRYRFGPPGKPELVLDSIAHLSSRPYPGGGETRLRFSNEGYDYLVFDLMRHREMPDEGTGLRGIEEQAGVHVVQGGVRLATLTCDGPAQPDGGKVLLGRLASGVEEQFVDLD